MSEQYISSGICTKPKLNWTFVEVLQEKGLSKPILWILLWL